MVELVLSFFILFLSFGLIFYLSISHLFLLMNFFLILFFFLLFSLVVGFHLFFLKLFILPLFSLFLLFSSLLFLQLFIELSLHFLFKLLLPDFLKLLLLFEKLSIKFNKSGPFIFILSFYMINRFR